MGNESSNNNLKNIFKSIKFSLNDSGKVIGLKNDKIAIFSDYKVNIYDQINKKEIDQIKLVDVKIINVIELENNDLIIHYNNGKTNEDNNGDIIQIYRIKNGKYDLFQTITDDYNNYQRKRYRIHCKICKTLYHLKYIQKIKNNRFITISTEGFKIYSYSNENSKYLCSLMNQYNDYKIIKKICEVNDDNLLIFARDFQTGGLGNIFPSFLVEYDRIWVDKFHIKDKNLQNIWNKKFTYQSLETSNYVILKNKYLVIRINKEFYLFDIEKGKKLIIYFPLWFKDNHGELYSWESVNNDVFLSINNGIINLIHFNDTFNSLNVIERYNFEYIHKIENINHFYFYRDEDTKIKSIDFY